MTWFHEHPTPVGDITLTKTNDALTAAYLENLVPAIDARRDAKAFREVGGFNNDLFAGEEIDLTRRLKRLARRQRKKLVILHRHPLLTSARKAHLYPVYEHVWFFLKAVLSFQRTLKNRRHCRTWYDGRR
jgi:hypothetical protein